MLEAARKYGTNVICNTDSHYADSVGDFRNCDILLREMDFPQELILNNSMEKLKLLKDIDIDMNLIMPTEKNLKKQEWTL